MNENQLDPHRSAVEAFEESIEQLKHLFDSRESRMEDSPEGLQGDRASDRVSPTPTSCPENQEEALWDDAVADIERYLQQQESSTD
jgi:hypothetical protein